MMILSCMIGTVGLFVIASTDSSMICKSFARVKTESHLRKFDNTFSKNQLDISYCLFAAWFTCSHLSSGSEFLDTHNLEYYFRVRRLSYCRFWFKILYQNIKWQQVLTISFTDIGLSLACLKRFVSIKIFFEL